MVTGGNRSNFGDFLIVTLNFFGGFFDSFDDFGAGIFDSLAKFHRIDASGDELVGFGKDIISEDGDSGGTIASDFVEFLSGGFDEFGADLLAEVFFGGAEVDGFSDGDAVMSDSGGAVGFLNDDVLAFGAESNFDSVVELFCAGEDFVTSLVGIKDFLCHIRFLI